MLKELVEDLKRNPLMFSARIETAILPVVYGAAEQKLDQEITRVGPDLILALGEAPGDRFRLEVQAFNLDDSKYTDNAGVIRQKAPIVVGAPERYLTLLPIHDMQERLKRAALPSAISYSAGDYLCNHLFYQLIHRIGREPEGQRPIAGFIHVPVLPKDGGKTYADWGKWGAPALRIMLESALEKAKKKGPRLSTGAL